MNRLPAGITNSALASVKSLPLPAALRTEGMPSLLKNLFMGQVAFYGFYQLISGPNRMKLKRYFTVSPESGLQSLATFHFCHTSVWPLLVNLGALSTLGTYIAKTQGTASFVRLFGLGCAGASLAVAVDARSNAKQVQAGSLGASPAMLAYGAFKYPQYFALLKFQPVTFVALALTYGIYMEDKAVVGGIGAGYLAFLMAL